MDSPCRKERVVEHIGGHSGKTWTDEGALKAILKRSQGKTFLDVGCGPGGQIEVAKSFGLQAFGLDGDPIMAKNPAVQLCDFSVTKVTSDILEALPESGYFDIGWSTEFLEHVDAEFIPNYMPAFALCKYVVITHATPGQGGYHHVNEQLFAYWEKIFAEYGLVHDKGLTKRIRKLSTMRTKKINHFQGFDEDGEPLNIKKRSSFMKKTGRVFRNERL